MKEKRHILPALFLVFVLLLSGCNSGGDRVERFAEAAPTGAENISIPGYEKLKFTVGRTSQTVNLKNPPENACTFVLTLSLDDGETLWTGEALSPGEEFTRITLNRSLDKGEYPAKLHYDCYKIEDNTQLNGAEIKLILEVK